MISETKKRLLCGSVWILNRRGRHLKSLTLGTMAFFLLDLWPLMSMGRKFTGKTKEYNNGFSSESFEFGTCRELLNYVRTCARGRDQLDIYLETDNFDQETSISLINTETQHAVWGKCNFASNQVVNFSVSAQKYMHSVFDSGF
mmetsp:Transcript_22973/g.53275  ORF Transcript_22973/g.53275 Transcript_22973/m.53275 type:complete len:144 (-) Transcript_22973:329-760(-)